MMHEPIGREENNLRCIRKMRLSGCCVFCLLIGCVQQSEVGARVTTPPKGESLHSLNESGSERGGKSEMHTPRTSSPSAFVCEKWAELGPRYHFVQGDKDEENFREDGLGVESPFSIRLPGTIKPSRWWMGDGIRPACEKYPETCWNNPFKLFEGEPEVEICGTKSKETPIRLVTFTQSSTSLASIKPKKAEDIARNCNLGRATLYDTIGSYPHQLSRREYSFENGTCIAEASNMTSFTEGAGGLHYVSLMRFDVNEEQILRQATIVFVVDEEDWPELKPVILASVWSFQVDWDLFNKRYPWEFGKSRTE